MFLMSSVVKVAVGFVAGCVGGPALKSEGAKKVYTYMTAGAFIARDRIMEEVEKMHAAALDTAEDAKVITEKYYAKKDRAYEAAKAAENAVEETDFTEVKEEQE